MPGALHTHQAGTASRSVPAAALLPGSKSICVWPPAWRAEPSAFTLPLLPPLQMSLTAVMVTQFPIRLTVYAQQFEDVAANAVGSSGQGGDDQGAAR